VLGEQRYRGGETTGFQSPAPDHITKVVDLADLLDLRLLSRYAVRVDGHHSAGDT
jgi:DNA polymerase V